MTTKLPAGMTLERADELAASMTPIWEEVFGPPVARAGSLSARPPAPETAATRAATGEAAAPRTAARASGRADVSRADVSRADVSRAGVSRSAPGAASGRLRAAARVGEGERGRVADAVPSSAQPSERIDLPTSALPIGKIAAGVALVATVVALILVFSGDGTPRPEGGDRAPAAAPAPKPAAPVEATGESTSDEPAPQPKLAPKLAEPTPKAEPPAPEPTPKTPDPKTPDPKTPAPKTPAPKTPAPKTPAPKPAPSPKPTGDIVREVPF